MFSLSIGVIAAVVFVALFLLGVGYFSDKNTDIMK